MEVSTMTELHDWYMSLSSSKRSKKVYIGLNSDQVGAKGIFIQSGLYVAYENAVKGPRVILYEGASEAEAVGCLYEVLKKEAEDVSDDGVAKSVMSMFVPNSDFLEQENLPIPKQFYLLIFVTILLIMLVCYSISWVSRCDDSGESVFQESVNIVSEDTIE